MKVIFIKECGHHPKGQILECAHAAGIQYITGGFAEVYVEPKPEKPKSKPKAAVKEEKAAVKE